MSQMKKTIKSYSKYTHQPRENFKDKLNYLKGAVDVEYLLADLGFNITHQTPKEVRCACPIHGGDNQTAFRFNKETRTWVCFTHKCHELHGNDIIGLIKAITDRDFLGALNYLKALVGDVGGVDYIEARRNREIDNFIGSYDNFVKRPDSVNESSLEKHKYLRSDLFLKEGFKPDTLDYFEIAGGWKDKHDLIRDIIPIRDDAGNLLAYSLRDIRTNSDDDFKYIHTPGFDKDSCLYNLNNAQHYTDRLPLIVVEGFKSVWRLYEYGIPNVVAVMGSTITSGQQMLLLRHAFKGAVIMFDNDLAGVAGTIKAIETLSDKLTLSPVFIQETDENGKGLDPADLTKAQVYEYLTTYF
jgi:5S rRNA maturation endonuclease (ribonuclease M5)